jgi:hypothetical protein
MFASSISHDECDENIIIGIEIKLDVFGNSHRRLLFVLYIFKLLTFLLFFYHINYFLLLFK